METAREEFPKLDLDPQPIHSMGFVAAFLFYKPASKLRALAGGLYFLALGAIELSGFYMRKVPLMRPKLRRG